MMKNAKQAVQDTLKHIDEMERLCRIDGDAITLISGPSTYDIHLSRCDTPEKIIGWVVHLSEKTWMSRDLIHKFVVTACNHHGIDAHPKL